MDIPLKIENLRQDLLKDKLTPEEIFQKHVVQTECFFFTDIIKDASKEYKTKSMIAEYMGVHLHEVILIGSAKLGYSLKPKNVFNIFDSKFQKTKINKDKSDIDIAIVSSFLFEQISKRIFDFTDSFRTRWEDNEYYFGEKLKNFDVPICYKYFEYFSKGWFRPDMKPSGFEFCAKESFEKLKKYLFNDYKRKFSFGIYKDWYYFKNYHINNIKSLSYRLKREPI